MNFEIEIKNIEESTGLLQWARRFKKYDLFQKILTLFPAALSEAENILISSIRCFDEDMILVLLPFINVKEKYPNLIFDSICFEMNRVFKYLVEEEEEELVVVVRPDSSKFFKMHNYAEGMSLLHAAVISKNLKVAEFLLEKYQQQHRLLVERPPPPPMAFCSTKPMFELLLRYKVYEKKEDHVDIIIQFMRHRRFEELKCLLKTFKIGVYTAEDLYHCIEEFKELFEVLKTRELKELWCLFLRNLEPALLNAEYFGMTALDSIPLKNKFMIRSLIFYGAHIHRYNDDDAISNAISKELNLNYKNRLLLLSI